MLLSEINPFRLQLARDLGLEAVNPKETGLADLVAEQTGGADADVIFEVSGSQAGAEVMTQLARTRGRIVIVAIFAEPPKIDLFRFFWRELRLCGALTTAESEWNRPTGELEGSASGPGVHFWTPVGLQRLLSQQEVVL